MCENGINVDQLKVSIAQVNDSLGMSQTWLEQLHHMADHGSKKVASTELAQVTVLLGEARAKLDRALDDLEGTAREDVTVELV
jgi:hypothetical protein